MGMGGRFDVKRFFRSRTGSGFIKFLLLCALLSAGVSYGFYRLSVWSFTANKSEEKITALQLVDAFVANYSNLRSELRADWAPVPATFRAHSIETFNKARDADNLLRLRWVGRPGRFINTPPTDAEMAEAIEAFAGESDPRPRSGFFTIGGEQVFRTVYPSFASQQSCVDCHNKLQPEQHWRLNELMGAFSIDAPAGPFLHKLYLECIGFGMALFVAMGSIGLTISVLHYRQLAERETAQGRIEDSEQRFRDFAEVSSDWFWEQDADLRISFVSENDVSRRLRATHASQIGKTRWEVVTLGVTEEQRHAHDADLAARRSFHRFRFQRIDVNGQLRHVEINGKPIFDSAGGFKGYRGTARDITAEIANELELSRRVEERTSELRRVQGELLRKERLSTLGQFTATVAHELRNPLSAIRNTAFSIAEIASAAGLKLERPLARLERSIARCDRLIAELLEYTRVRELKRERLFVDDWLADVLDEQKLPESVTVKRDFAAPGVEADFDPDRLRRVIINLVENAVQAVVELPAANVDSERSLTITTRATDGVVQIGFDDTGPGIPSDVLSQVFDPLFSTKSFGTGLGLATVKQIVEQHGGTVEIASEVGRGTRVVVALPLASSLRELAA
jgi:PAS domain S-box-containing protein